MNPQPTTHNLQPNRGFTLIEMVVVMGIFALLSSTLFINYSQFSVNASLNNLTHQIALIARQAQVYGISVSQTVSGSQKFKGYGVYFSTETLDDQKTVILFNDWNPANKVYDPIVGGLGPCNGDVNDECQEKITIQSGDMVEKIMANEKTAVPGTELNDVSVVFTRPNPEANFVAFRKDNPAVQFGDIADLEVYLISVRGTEKKVIIWSTGQISVE
jgi:prepilin-type N-terminal cleavage/methylation domain-containing protein